MTHTPQLGHATISIQPPGQHPTSTQFKQLSGKLSEVNARVTPACEISQPLLSRTDIRSERDPVRRTNKEEHKDFAVAGLLWVDKSEGLDLTLTEIGRAWVLALIAV